MKNRINRIVIFIIIYSFFACQDDSSRDSELLTPKKVKEIIKKHNLKEGTFKINPLRRNGDSDIEPIKLTVKEFEVLVANMAKYQNSEEWKKAYKLNQIVKKSREEKWSKEKLDNAYKAFDKEFGTDIYKFHHSELKPGEHRISTYYMSQHQIDSMNAVNKRQ